jgi:hypothetical protein
LEETFTTAGAGLGTTFVTGTTLATTGADLGTTLATTGEGFGAVSFVGDGARKPNSPPLADLGCAIVFEIAAGVDLTATGTTLVVVGVVLGDGAKNPNSPPPVGLDVVANLVAVDSALG